MLVFIILLCLYENQIFLISGCELPEHPANGKWQVFGLAAALSPGDTVPGGSPLFVTCHKGFKLLDTQLGLCDGQEFQWQIKMGHCSKTCPELTETDKVKVTCRLRNELTGDINYVKCSEATDGTVAQFECAEYYTITVDNSTESIRSGRSGLSKCKNGKWTVDRPNCDPRCGLKSLTGVTLSVHGKTAAKGSYPWQAAIYEYDVAEDTYHFTCGGSLINERVILTAAHCVTDNEGNVRPLHTLTIAGGKYYQNWTDKRDSNVFQSNTVQKALVPRRYKGFLQNFFGDLAVLILEEPFKLNSLVQPICVDWNKIYRRKFLTPMNIGFVSGWGVVSETGAVSEELQEIELPYVTNDVCAKAISVLDEGYLTEDKICLGYVNQSKGVCAGDSGGALVFKSSFDNRYYLNGIVSISPDVKPGAKCNSQLYSLFTEVYSYIDFIREKAAEYQGSASPKPPTSSRPYPPRTTTTAFTTTTRSPVVLRNCELPQQLANGKWEILGTDRFTSENRTKHGSVLGFKCHDGYILSGTELNICQDEEWQIEVPSCSKTCPQLSNALSCVKYNTGDVWSRNNCSLATDGTIATVQCDTKIGTGIQNLHHNQAFSVCSGGNWSTVDCNQECGRGNETAYPWKVAIYEEAVDSSPKFICGGVLINERIILTAAHCVSDSEGKALHIGNYMVAVGNHRVNFNDTSDAPDIQILKLKHARFPSTYKGYSNNFLGDIAVLVTNKCVNMTENVQPACLDHLNVLKEMQLEGLVVGWGSETFNFSNPPESIEFSNKAKAMRVETVPKAECHVEEEYNAVLVQDKICLGYPRDESKRVCVGDGGNGFVVKNPSEGRFYVFALASVALDKACGNVSGFIKISDYLKWFIIEAILAFLPSKESCDLLLESDDLEENDSFGSNHQTYHDRVHSITTARNDRIPLIVLSSLLDG